MKNTFRKRYIASIFSNIIRSAFGFLSGLLLARFMGPVDYGRLSFLMVSFMAFRQIIDLGSSTAFFTFISKQKRSKKFISYYWFWVLMQFLLPLIFIILFFPEHLVKLIWSGESREIVALSFVSSFFQTTVWTNIFQMAESQRETVKVHYLSISIAVFHLLLILILWYFNLLQLENILIVIIMEYIAGSLYGLKLFELNAIQAESNKETFFTIFAEYKIFCTPLVIYSIVGFFHDYLDRRMLQEWGGSIEQAFFTVSMQFSSISLIATSSIVKILWKEIAEAYAEDNIAKLEIMFTKSLKVLFFISLVISAWLMSWSDVITVLMLGDKYSGSSYVMMLMFFYPVYQAAGQITGTLLYATGKTRMQSRIGVMSMVLGLIISYFMMAPVTNVIPGMGFSSIGLAYKMLVTQFVVVNVLLYAISYVFKWEYDPYYQLKIIAVVLSLAYGISFGIRMATGTGFFGIYSMILSILVYLIILLVIVYLFPSLAGISKDDLHKFRNFNC